MRDAIFFDGSVLRSKKMLIRNVSCALLVLIVFLVSCQPFQLSVHNSDEKGGKEKGGVLLEKSVKKISYTITNGNSHQWVDIAVTLDVSKAATEAAFPLNITVDDPADHNGNLTTQYHLCPKKSVEDVTRIIDILLMSVLRADFVPSYNCDALDFIIDTVVDKLFDYQIYRFGRDGCTHDHPSVVDLPTVYFTGVLILR